MQLAGKPSLIDPARAIAKAKERKGPLQFESIEITPIAGEAGKQLEQLYAAYFDVQRALAADKLPPAKAAQTLRESATQIQQEPSLPKSSIDLLREIATHSEHLHHLDLPAARNEFKPISHAVITLGTQVRSAQAKTTFTHFYCPMVKGGGGDWLQPDAKLLNPYYGSQMLRCGEKVHDFPPTTPVAVEDDATRKSHPQSQGKAGE
jgi:Cu(I)/Ag(I) efflux system membrane fusion protein